MAGRSSRRDERRAGQGSVRSISPVGDHRVRARVNASRFPRSRRLLRGIEFQEVLRRPVRSSDDCFSVAARRRNETAPGFAARLGLAISRKALPRSVDRNRVKRLVRETFRQTRFPCALDLVVVARSGLKRADNARVRASLAVHFTELTQTLCRHAVSEPADAAATYRTRSPFSGRCERNRPTQ